MNKIMNARDTVFRYISQLIYMYWYIYIFFLGRGRGVMNTFAATFYKDIPRSCCIAYYLEDLVSGIQRNTVDDKNQDIDTEVESVGIYCRY